MKLNLFITFLLLSVYASAQRYHWVSHADIAGTNNMIPVGVDPAGNVYSLIHTNSDAVIQGDTIHTLTGSEGGVVTKFDPSGNFLWGTMVNCDGGILPAFKLVVDEAGATYSTFYFGNGGQVHLADTVFTPSAYGTLIIKIDSSGHFVHARPFPGNASIPISCLGTDLYIGLEDQVMKLDSALNTVWTVSAPPSTISFASAGSHTCDIYVNQNGELVVSGHESGNSIGIIPFGNDSIRFTPAGYDEEAVIKMDTTGQVIWTHAMDLGSSGQPPLRAVCLDSHGNAYAGVTQADQQNIFANDTLVNAVGGSIYCAILKWDSSGSPVRGIGIYPFNFGPDIFDLAVNALDELLVSGSDNTDNNSINGDTIVHIDHTSYLFKFDTAGNFIWHKPGPSSWCYGDGLAVRNGNEYIQGGSTGNTGTFQLGCIAYTTPVQSDWIALITEQPEWNPVASFTYSVVNDTTYNFSDQSTDATRWHWDFGDGDTSNIPSPSHDFTAGGNYSISLTVYHGACSSTFTVPVFGVGLNDPDDALAFSVYPNPSPGELTIRFSHEQKNVTVELFSALGETLFSSQTINVTTKTIELPGLANGVYDLRVEDGVKSYNRRILIEHN